MDRQSEENVPFIPLEEEGVGRQHRRIDYNDSYDKPPQQMLLGRFGIICLLMFFITVADDLVSLGIVKQTVCSAMGGDPASDQDRKSMKCLSSRGTFDMEQNASLITSPVTEIISSVITIVVLVPLGLVADQYGKKRVLLLALAGVVTGGFCRAIIAFSNGILPSQLSWISTIPASLFGGLEIIQAILFALASDTMPRGRLLTAFVLLASVSFMRFGQTALFALDPGINPLLMVILGVFLYGLAVPIVLLIQEDDAVPLEFTSTSFVSALKRLRDIAFIREELFRLLRMVCRDRRMWFILSSLGIILLLTPLFHLVLAVFRGLSLVWAIPTLIASQLCCCCCSSISSLTRDLWVARVLAIFAIPAVILGGIPGTRSDVGMDLFAVMILAGATIGAFSYFQVAIKAIFLQLPDGNKDVTALLALLGVLQAIVLLISRGTVPLFILMGAASEPISLGIYIIALVLLFFIRP